MSTPITCADFRAALSRAIGERIPADAPVQRAPGFATIRLGFRGEMLVDETDARREADSRIARATAEREQTRTTADAAEHAARMAAWS